MAAPNRRAGGPVPSSSSSGPAAASSSSSFTRLAVGGGGVMPVVGAVGTVGASIRSRVGGDRGIGLPESVEVELQDSVEDLCERTPSVPVDERFELMPWPRILEEMTTYSAALRKVRLSFDPPPLAAADDAHRFLSRGGQACKTYCLVPAEVPPLVEKVQRVPDLMHTNPGAEETAARAQLLQRVSAAAGDRSDQLTPTSLADQLVPLQNRVEHYNNMVAELCGLCKQLSDATMPKLKQQRGEVLDRNSRDARRKEIATRNAVDAWMKIAWREKGPQER
eukprot:GHVU01211195.1.p1 GENE.GHVU01211195.1~~GHVU01211195.1.p1  ORF type:complete len:279 (-),score=40.80 GHVU01211195.1:694-1530(-)